MITEREVLYFWRRDQDALERALKSKVRQEERCASCGKARETMEHVLLECEDICPVADLGSTGLLDALSFSESREKVKIPAVEISKRRLEVWWKKRGETINSGGIQKKVPNRGSESLMMGIRVF